MTVFHVPDENGEGGVACVEKVSSGAHKRESAGKTLLHGVEFPSVIACARKFRKAMSAGKPLMGCKLAAAHVAFLWQHEIKKVVNP